MKIPLPSDKLQSLVNINATEHTIERPSDNADASKYGETVDSTQEITRDVYVFDPQETNISTQFGEREQGGMMALTLPNIDLQKHDIIVDVNGRFEVEETNTFQQYGQAVYDEYSLQRVSNER